MVRNPPVNAGDIRDTRNHIRMVAVPGSGRFSREENGDPLQSSCLGNPWTEEPGGQQSKGSQSWTWLSAHAHTHTQHISKISHILYGDKYKEEK